MGVGCVLKAEQTLNCVILNNEPQTERRDDQLRQLYRVFSLKLAGRLTKATTQLTDHIHIY